jgi:hypothetical protein
MKTCMSCGKDAADDMASCPSDGEASWGPVFDITPDTEPSEQPADPPFQLSVKHERRNRNR